MTKYKLLTPGPLTTTQSVKQAMMVDHCTWDKEYKIITREICNDLLELALCSKDEYSVVLMQGSGTFGVESVITSSVGEGEKILICSNGAYGERMCKIAEYGKIPYINYKEEYDNVPNATKVEEILIGNPDITHIAMVHSETTSGILNPVLPISSLAKKYGKTFILDAMSSFGGVEFDVANQNVDILISSANKCIQGVPGFSFVIGRREALEACKGKARSLSLDLYSQWETLEKDDKWRFTSPTHVVLAFGQAIKELKDEGGITKREERYRENNEMLIAGMEAMGFKSFVKKERQSPIITTFYYPPNQNIVFDDFYKYIKNRGYAIYPGKLTEADTFRIGNIGEIYKDDIAKILSIIGDYLEEVK
ncbi:MAG: 2-aminoethylphosphonate--pyruvate transaminase [Anaerovoracaceae bacterium]